MQAADDGSKRKTAGGGGGTGGKPIRWHSGGGGGGVVGGGGAPRLPRENAPPGKVAPPFALKSESAAATRTMHSRERIPPSRGDSAEMETGDEANEVVTPAAAWSLPATPVLDRFLAEVDDGAMDITSDQQLATSSGAKTSQSPAVLILAPLLALNRQACEWRDQLSSAKVALSTRHERLAALERELKSTEVEVDIERVLAELAPVRQQLLRVRDQRLKQKEGEQAREAELQRLQTETHQAEARRAELVEQGKKLRMETNQRAHAHSECKELVEELQKLRSSCQTLRSDISRESADCKSRVHLMESDATHDKKCDHCKRGMLQCRLVQEVKAQQQASGQQQAAKQAVKPKA